MKLLRFAFLLGFGCLAACALAPLARAEGFSFTTNANGTLTLTGHSRPEGALAIPAVLDGKPVAVIGAEAFAYSARLTGISFPDSIVEIEPQAFAFCSTLTNVVFGTGLSRLGEWAFRGCTRLAAIQVPPSNLSFASSDGILFTHDRSRLVLFPACISGTYEIPSTVVEIADDAFARTAGLTNVLVPSNVIRIGNWAFDRSGLAQIAIPNSVISLGTGAFSGCTRLQYVTLGAGLLRIEPRTFERSGLLTITLPPSVSEIADWAFFNCPHLVGVTLGPATRQIGHRAFQGCCALPRMVLPAGVRILGEEAFSDCPALAEVVCGGNAPEAGPDLFAGSDQVVVICPPGTTGWNERFGDRPVVQSPSPIPGQ